MLMFIGRAVFFGSCVCWWGYGSFCFFLFFSFVATQLWRTPILAPFKLITVFLHEASHATACKLTCGKVSAAIITSTLWMGCKFSSSVKLLQKNPCGKFSCWSVKGFSPAILKIPSNSNFHIYALWLQFPFEIWGWARTTFGRNGGKMDTYAWRKMNIWEKEEEE